MRRIMMTVAACVALVATGFLAPKPAEAAGGRGSYCLDYNEGGMDCGFTSLAQCNATASGINAECNAVAPLAAMQEPGEYAFYHPNAGVEAAGPPEAAMAAMSMRSRNVSRVHRNGT